MIYGEAEQEGFAQKVSCGAAAARRRYFASVVEAWRWMAFALRGALRAIATDGKVASDAVKVAAKEDERKIFKALSLFLSSLGSSIILSQNGDRINHVFQRHI